MTVDTKEKEVGAAPAEGKITPEAIKAAENMIGMQLRPEGPYLQDATEDTIRNFCNGIGDLNPLYRDLEVGRPTRHGSMLAHPNFPMAFGWVGRTRWGLPGVHGFYAGNDWEMFRQIRPGDRLTAIERVVGVGSEDVDGRLAAEGLATLIAWQPDVLMDVARVVAEDEEAAVVDAGSPPRRSCRSCSTRRFTSSFM